MAHGVLIPEAIAAMNTDSLNRSVASTASSIDNGFVLLLTGKIGTSGSGAEVWTATTPATGSLSGLWMAYDGEEIPVTDSRYKGLDPDPRNAYIAQNKVFSAFKPQVGDIILVTPEALTGSVSTYANAVNGAYQLTWAATSGAGQSWKLLGTKYISIHSSASTVDMQRATAYELECIIA